jgi:predicted phosphodiesterase
MKITVFSDVHGHIQALEEMYKREKDSDLYVCLGDVVGYGPFVNECLELLFTKEKHVYIGGNHEDMYIAGMSHERCSPMAKSFFEKTYPLYDKKFNNFLRSFLQVEKVEDAVFSHTFGDRYLYPDSDFEDLMLHHRDDETIFNSEFFFFGHSHVQFLKVLMPQLVGGQEKTFVNPGSLGQNRIDKGLSCYANYYPLKKVVDFKSFENDIESLVGSFKELGFSENLIKYYQRPIRDLSGL